MRITLVIGSLQAGGAERVMSVLANALSREHSVTLVKMVEGPDHYALTHEVSVVGLPPQGRSRLVRATIGKLGTVLDLRRVIRASAPDVVLSFIDITNARTILATRFLSVPVVISERVDPRMHRIVRSHDVLRRLTYRWADHLVVQSEAVVEWAEGLTDPGRISVLPNPLGFEPSPDVGEERSLVVLGVGRLAEQKGFDVLIDAFSRVALQHPKWTLRIVGQGPLGDDLRVRAQQSGFGSRIEFAGLKRHIVREYRTAGIFVLSSRYEGFPNALLEAIATGTPSIATDCRSGPAELIGASDGAVLVPVDDAIALAEAVDGLMADEEARRALGRRGLERSHEFTAERVVARWEALLDSVVGET